MYINGIDANYPPFTFINAKGEPDGLDVKAVNWIAEEMGFEVKHQPTEWDAYDSAPLAMEDIVNGRIDCAAVSTTSANEIMDKGVPVKILGKYGQPDDTVAYAVRKQDTELLNMLNKGLKRLMATDYWQELNEKYKLK